MHRHWVVLQLLTLPACALQQFHHTHGSLKASCHAGAANTACHAVEGGLVPAAACMCVCAWRNSMVCQGLQTLNALRPSLAPAVALPAGAYGIKAVLCLLVWAEGLCLHCY